MSIDLTIITVCYNSEKTIENCLKSVTKQLNDRIEYLIIDGASKDKTVEIIRRYITPNMVLVSEPDKGIYDAMNKGIYRARGNWIWFINSDDYIKDGLISSILNVIDKNSESDCIYGNMEYARVISENIIVEERKAPKTLSLLKNEMIIGHPSTICRRDSMIEIGGFDTRFKVAADWDLLLRLYNNKYKFVHIDRILSTFYTGGLSSKSHILERHKVRKKNNSYKIVDLYYIKDFLKQIVNFFIRPIKNMLLIKKIKKYKR